ncbi:MAG: zinc metallopeptidase [Clostridia bacterium]|nr:zinc metallopeptidase [Clostridia bacterium]
MFYLDIYYIVLVVPAIILSIIAQSMVQSRFKKYSQVFSAKGMTGEDTANLLLMKKGITDVSVGQISGSLTDNFNPRTKQISLSETVYSSSSVAAIGVAAHETGHAIQHHSGYVAIKMRNAVLPVAQLGSSAAMPLAIFGFILGAPALVNAGILLFSAVVLFQVVTLPVEFNASRRAALLLKETGVLSEEELAGAKKVLAAAALTYVAAMLTSLMSLLRLILLSRNRNR